MKFIRAQRMQYMPKIALTGPSGSGKTFSALLIASGFGKKIAVIDTENCSASLYANMDRGPLRGVEFDVCELSAPYTIRKYLDAFNEAERAGYGVLVVDSLTHAWAGEGGLLDKKASLDARGGNSWANWNTVTPEQWKLLSRIISADIPLIATMRSKQEHVLEVSDTGKQVPRKVGLAPIQRDGTEYEFTWVFDLAMNHSATVSKDRTSLFDGEIFTPSMETGRRIKTWLEGGKPIERRPAQVPPEPPASEKSGVEPPAPVSISPEQGRRISEFSQALQALGLSEATIWRGIKDEMMRVFGVAVSDTSAMSTEEAEKVADYLFRWGEYLKQKLAAAPESRNNENGKGEHHAIPQ